MTPQTQSEGWQPGESGVLERQFTLGWCESAERLRKRPANVPALADPVLHHFSINAKLIRPRRNALSFSKHGVQPIAAHVPLLFANRRPPAIPRLIISVVVRIAVNGMFWRRSRTHVGVEVLELAPAFTDCNSASAVAAPSRPVRVAASLPHTRPRSIFRRLGHSVSCRQSNKCCSRHFRGKAPARFNGAGAQITASNLRRLAAVANASPEICAAKRAEQANNQEPAKPLPDEVLKTLVCRNWAGDDQGGIDVVTHIVFSEGWTLLGFSPCALRL